MSDSSVKGYAEKASPSIFRASAAILLSMKPEIGILTVADVSAQNRSNNRRLLLERENLPPVLFHVHDRPALSLRLLERFVEPAD